MKRFHPGRQAARIGRMIRRLPSIFFKSGPTTLYQDMETGAVTGFFACTALTLHFAGGELSAAMLIFFSCLGIFLGAVIGAVLWIGGAPLPEETVLAPAPGQGRGKDEGRR